MNGRRIYVTILALFQAEYACKVGVALVMIHAVIFAASEIGGVRNYF